MGYRAGFVGEAQFTYTWPDAYAKAQRGLAFLRKRLERAELPLHRDDIVEYPGAQLDVGRLGSRRRTTRTSRARRPVCGALPGRDRGPQGLHRERAALQQRSGRRRRGRHPAAAQGAVRLWPCLVPREHVVQSVEMLEPATAAEPCGWPTSPTAGPATRATPATSGSSPTTTTGTRCCARRLTEERVAEHYGDLVKGTVTRYELPGHPGAQLRAHRCAGRRRHDVAALRPSGQGHVRLAAPDGAAVSDAVVVTRRGSMAVVTLNRPEPRNPLDPELSAALLRRGPRRVRRRRGPLGRHRRRGLRVLRRGRPAPDAPPAAPPARRPTAWPAAIVELHRLMLQAPEAAGRAVDGPAYAGGMGLAGICDVVLATRARAVRDAGGHASACSR